MFGFGGKARRQRLLALGMLGVLAVPAVAADDPAEANDPLEGLNRITSEFNRILRKTLIDPIVEGYQLVTPAPVQKAISNAASNLTEPVTAASSLLQGDLENTRTATERFIVNTTVGLGGTRDVAREEFGLEQRREDLGQALGARGVGAGPHLVLPILGPSNLRDAGGDAVLFLVNPLPAAATAATAGVGYADRKDEINAATRGALDPYVVEREAYEQNRAFQVYNSEMPASDAPTLAEE